jgi:hypothetical protein
LLDWKFGALNMGKVVDTLEFDRMEIAENL